MQFAHKTVHGSPSSLRGFYALASGLYQDLSHGYCFITSQSSLMLCAHDHRLRKEWEDLVSPLEH